MTTRRTACRAIARGLAALAGAAVLAAAPAHAHVELADVAAAVKPSVVAVGTFVPTDSPRFGFRGTGFAIGEGSTVVTNAHVLHPSGTPEAAKPVAVQLTLPGRRLEVRMATVIARDDTFDLALLRIDGAPLTPLRLSETAVREGQAIGLMGFPIGGALGYAPVLHQGIVSAVTTMVEPVRSPGQLTNRAMAALRAGPQDVYQLDLTAFPGNSGGPVFDARTGEVIGIVNKVLVSSTRESAISTPTGITYAIPARLLKLLLAR